MNNSEIGTVGIVYPSAVFTWDVNRYYKLRLIKFNTFDQTGLGKII